MPEAESVASTKTIAVSERVWELSKDIMKKERTKSLNEAVAKLPEEARGVPSSRFGVHKRLRVRLTQQEHEEITRDIH
jgi:hypothetical protein